MSDIYYLSEGRLYAAGGRDRELRSLTIENYRQTVKDIESRREWKTSGSGAAFMGIAVGAVPQELVTAVEAVAAVRDDKIIYAASLESSCGIYTKNPANDAEPEGYITRKMNSRFYHLAYEPWNRLIAVSAGDGAREKHLAVCHEDQASFRFITEGECVDTTPSFSRTDPNVIYFSSAGYYVDRAKSNVVYDTYNVSKFDLSSNEITELLKSPGYDYLSPKETDDGRLFCLRRPKREPERGGATLSDVVFFPVRLIKALFGWLNFFSQKYSGESLVKNTGGRNPAKNRQKSDEELFIEGNLVNVDKALRENRLAGDPYPGLIPKSWELAEIRDGEPVVVKRGVADYAFDGGDIIYSNGKYIIRLDGSGKEEKICEAKLARSLSVL